MRILLLASAAGLSLGGHELATDYGRERSLKTSSELELDLETTLSEMTIDGEPPPEDARGAGGSSSSLVRKCVLSDHFLAGAPGAPSKVRRSFETLRDESSFSFGEEQRGDERDFPLQGLTLELTREGEDGEVEVELVDGQRPDDESLLEGHELALALDAFLPEGPVEDGAKWDLDDAQLKRALASALDARLFADPPPEEGQRGGGGESGRRGFGGRGRGGPGRSLGLIEWQGKAELVALDEEHGGLVCAKIALVLEGKGDLPEFGGRGGGRGFLFAPSEGAPALAGTIEAKLEGALYFSLEKRRPVDLKLDGTLTTDNRSERERDGRIFASHIVQSGRLTLTVNVEEN